MVPSPCFMGIFFISGTRLGLGMHCTTYARMAKHSLGTTPTATSHTKLFRTRIRTATHQNNNNTKKKNHSELAKQDWPAPDQSRVPGTDKRTIIMIVTNEFPKCFGNVKNLIKIILRVMRPRFVCREHHHPQALVLLLLAHGF